MMLAALSIILILLILAVCGDKGSKSIITTIGNGFILIITVLFIYHGANPIIVTFAASAAAAALILFFQNEVSERSKLAFLTTMAVMVLLIPLVFFIAKNAGAEGFNPDQYEITDSNGYTRNIDLSMFQIQISVMLIALIGAAVDSSVAISSSVYEIWHMNPELSKEELTASAIKVGKSILNTSMHTIFYIYIAEYMTLMMQYVSDFTFMEMINSESFAEGFLSITVSGTGILLTIPISGWLTIHRIYGKKTTAGR